MPWARASGLDRHLECGAASWLPRGDRGDWAPGFLSVRGHAWVRPNVEAPRSGYQAQWGTEMHLAKASDPKAADPWLSWMDPHRERYWPQSLGKHEVPFGYDCRSGAVTRGPLGDAGDAWKETRGPDVVTGTCDWLGALPSGDPWVDDLKTGWPTPDPLSNQMKFYALCAVKLTGQRVGCRTSVTHWRRTWTEPLRIWNQLSFDQLCAFEEELRAAWKRARVRNAKPVAGDWCSWCPSKLVCPKHVEGVNT